MTKSTGGPIVASRRLRAALERIRNQTRLIPQLAEELEALAAYGERTENPFDRTLSKGTLKMESRPPGKPPAAGKLRELEDDVASAQASLAAAIQRVQVWLESEPQTEEVYAP